jgi:hypothetical protein
MKPKPALGTVSCSLAAYTASTVMAPLAKSQVHVFLTLLIGPPYLCWLFSESMGLLSTLSISVMVDLDHK